MQVQDPSFTLIIPLQNWQMGWTYNGNERWFVGHTPTQEAKYYLPKKYSKYVNEQTNTLYTFNNITLMDTGSFITKELYSKKYGLGKISCLEITTNTLYQA